jgi:mannan polymerase II complex MNN10 subunit
VVDYHEKHATEEHQLSEQDCIRDIIFKEKRFADNTFFIPQHRINAFPKEIKCYDKTKKKWEPGMFTLHFAGAWAYLHDQDDPTGYLMEKYEPEIMW